MEEAPQWLQNIRKTLMAVRNREIEENNCFEVISLEDVPENYPSFLTKDEEEEIFECAGFICAQTNETGVHENAAIHISRHIRKALNSRGGAYDIGATNIPIAKLYSCGDIRVKKPDISISKDFEGLDPEIVGEIEYAHLDLAGLLEESIFLLTEYTTPKYSFAVKIFPRQVDFRCIIFVLERLEDNVFDPHKRDAIKKMLKSKKPQKGKCIKKADFSQIDIFDPNVNRDLREFGVRMVFLQQVLEADIQQDVIIPLEAYRDPIVLPSQMFINLRNLHRERWNDLHGEQ